MSIHADPRTGNSKSEVREFPRTIPKSTDRNEETLEVKGYWIQS